MPYNFMDCDNCKLNGQEKVLSVGDVHSDFWIVGSAPTVMEERQGTLLMGDSGDLLKDIFKEYGSLINFDDYMLLMQ